MKNEWTINLDLCAALVGGCAIPIDAATAKPRSQPYKTSAPIGLLQYYQCKLQSGYLGRDIYISYPAKQVREYHNGKCNAISVHGNITLDTM